MTIILHGMCYSGKSTLGKLLAERLGIPFLDSRDLFFREHRISEIEFLSKYGRDLFIKAEKKSLNQSFGNIVLSVGGSAIYYPEQMSNLSKYNIIWLDVSYDLIIDRKSREGKERPIVYPDGIITFEELYNQRVKLYPKYTNHRIIVNQKESPEETINKILTVIPN